MTRRDPPHSVAELVLRAQALTGHSIAALANALGMPLPTESRRAKGFLGQLVEHALGSDPLAFDLPDFPYLGVELKTIPVNDQLQPLESTFCCSINMASADVAQWENSRLHKRLSCVLWVAVQGAKTMPMGDRSIVRTLLWRPDHEQMQRLRADWEDLMGAIGAGRAEQLTAHQGQILQVRPKAANASVRRLGASDDGPTLLKPLGFYLRPSFTAEILRQR